MLTPLEIENKKFSRQMMNGYNVDEVDDFLDELTMEYEKLYKENAEIKEKIEDLDKEVEHYRNIEATLQNTLIVAQQTSEDMKNIAKQKADQIVEEAEGNARKSVEDLSQTIVLKKKELEEVKKNFDVYKAKMESLLISQLELLKDMNEDI